MTGSQFDGRVDLSSPSFLTRQGNRKIGRRRTAYAITMRTEDRFATTAGGHFSGTTRPRRRSGRSAEVGIMTGRNHRRATLALMLLIAAIALSASTAWPTTDTTGVQRQDGTVVVESVTRHPLGYVWMAAMLCAAAAAATSAMMYIRHRPKGTIIALTVAGLLSLPTVLAPILAVAARRMLAKEESGRDN